jgi:hypothetical protein
LPMRAKFLCTKIEASCGGFLIDMEPVTSGSPENDAFYLATPGGHIKLASVRLAAADACQVGHEYYVDFTRADLAPPPAVDPTYSTPSTGPESQPATDAPSGSAAEASASQPAETAAQDAQPTGTPAATTAGEGATTAEAPPAWDSSTQG